LKGKFSQGKKPAIRDKVSKKMAVRRAPVKKRPKGSWRQEAGKRLLRERPGKRQDDVAV